MKPIESDDSLPSSDDALEREVEEMIETTDRDYSTKQKARSKSRRASQKQKGYISAASFVAWIAFASIWLLFRANLHGIFENIAIIVSGLLVILLANALFWIPSSAGPGGSGTRTKLATIILFGWLIFVIIWWPFYGEFFNVYQNYSISLISFVIGLVLVAGTFLSIPGTSGMNRQSAAGSIVLMSWLVFLIVWLWFPAIDYTFYQNVAIVIFSFTVLLVLMVAAIRSILNKTDEGPDGWGAFVVGICWLLFLSLWFWMFAGDFLDYQNVGIFFLSLVAAIGIGYFVEKRKYDSIDSLDFDKD